MSMKPRQRQAVLLALADAMRERGSWCGETHLQKAAYFLEDLAGIPLELGFILYKHGPFSFELRDELTAMRADGLLEMRIPQPPYGPSLVSAKNAEKLLRRWPRTLEEYRERIGFVASQLGSRGVGALERLGTALYVTRERPGTDAGARARRIRELKRHVSAEDAKAAVEEVDKMIEQMKGLVCA